MPPALMKKPTETSPVAPVILEYTPLGDGGSCGSHWRVERFDLLAAEFLLERAVGRTDDDVP